MLNPTDALVQSLRLAFAISVFLAVSWALISVFSPSSVELIWSLIDRFFPAISAVTKNTNTDDWGAWLMLPLAIAAGLTCGALVWDPQITTKTEAIVTPVVFVLLIGASSVNFWSHDTLISANASDYRHIPEYR